MGLINKLLWRFVRLFPENVDVIHTEGKPYLLRFFLKHSGKLPGIYLHYFYRSDSDRHLHNHPWAKSLSFILSGGYKETRITPSKGLNIKTRFLTPGCLNRIGIDDFHKVQLLSDQTWSLFISMNRTQTWGFWVDGRFVPFTEYFSRTDKEGSYITDLNGVRKKFCKEED